MTLVPLPFSDGTLAYDRDFLPAAEADDLFHELRAELAWEQPVVTMFGRKVPSPRLACWYGEAAYTYSGLRNPPRAWTPALARVRARVSAATGLPWNGVLANLYRNGDDGMGWHSDDEAELGPAPVIASVSLGAARRFTLRHRKCRDRAVSIELEHGSLLVMGGETQAHWRHALPKTKRPVGPRINLTFRLVKGDGRRNG